jgi:hypothetical protein
MGEETTKLTRAAGKVIVFMLKDAAENERAKDRFLQGSPQEQADRIRPTLQGYMHVGLAIQDATYMDGVFERLHVEMPLALRAKLLQEIQRQFRSAVGKAEKALGPWASE